MDITCLIHRLIYGYEYIMDTKLIYITDIKLNYI